MYENEDQGFLSLVDAFGGAKSDRGLRSDDAGTQVHTGAAISTRVAEEPGAKLSACRA